MARVPLHHHGDFDNGGPIRGNRGASTTTVINNTTPPQSLALNDLSDVGGTPSDGDVLTYGTASSSWAPAASAGGASLVVNDEGSTLGTATVMDFVGSGIAATFSGGTATVTVNATSGLIVADEGSTLGTATVLNVTGPGGTASFSGGTATLNIPGIVVQEEGSAVGTAAILNFVGSSITATYSGGTATVTDSGGGGGSYSVPGYVQGKGSVGLNTQNPTLTLGATPTSGNKILLGLNLVGRAATNVTQTNVTWTKMFGVQNGSGSRYEIWIGAVGAGAGTVITVSTGSSNFSSLVAIEISGVTVTPTAGTSTSGAQAAVSGTVGSLNGITAGHLVAILVGAEDTTKTIYVWPGVPHVGYSQAGSGTGVFIGACFAPSAGSITAQYQNANTANVFAIIGEIT